MSGMTDCRYWAEMYCGPPESLTVGSMAARTSSFLIYDAKGRVEK